MGIKMVVVGAASSYTPELFATLAENYSGLDVEEVVLVDLNPEKLDFIAAVCQRIIQERHLPLKLSATTSVVEALPGADFVLAQIRVGGLAARVRDETLPMEFSLVGNETTGAGGFVCAMRTLPPMLELARQVEKLAPKSWILNMSNPAGIVTEAILKHSGARALGFCNIPINTTYHLAEILNVDPSRIQLDSFGLNHLSWVRRALVDGEDRLQPLVDQACDTNAVVYQHGLVEEHLTPRLLQTVRMIPSWYVRYFYYPEIVIEEDLAAGHTKGTQDMQAEEELRSIYISEGYNARARQILSEKGGAQYYLPVLQAVESILTDRGDVIVLDTLNQGALPDLPPGVCVEVPSRIYRDHVEPLPAGPMPLSVRGLVQTVKAYEELTIEAAVSGRIEAALAALMANPLAGTYPKSWGVLERVMQNEQNFFQLH